MRRDSGHPLTQLRVLVAEDEFFIADDLVNALKAAGAIPVGPVSTPEEADELLDEAGVDAAIFDINLRGSMAGEVALKAKEMKLPCIIVSGYSEAALPEAARNIRRLEKPIDSSKIVQALTDELGMFGLVDR